MSRIKTQNRIIHHGHISYIVCIHKDREIYISIDTEDLERVIVHKWCVREVEKTGYLYPTTAAWTPSKGQQTIVLARYIVNPPPKLQIDHIDRNPLNCCKSNLRIVTPGQNQQNLSSNGRTALGRGVSRRDEGLYRARVQIDRQMYNLGSFPFPEDAQQVAADFRAKYMPFSQDALKRTGVEVA